MTDFTAIAGVRERELLRPGAKVASTLLAFDDEFSEASAVAMIAAIEDGFSLSFFDAEHPQRSDPGLYVNLQRRDGELFVKGANHGWSYPWLPIAENLAARWLWLCRSYNTADGSYESSSMRVSRATSFTPDLNLRAGESFTKWLTQRIAN